MNQEIKKEAIAVFTQYPLAKEVFITPDVQAFLKEDRARIHNKDYEKVKRSDVMEEKTEEPDANKETTQKATKKSAEELIAYAVTAETIEELDAILAAGEKRATVLAAFAARKAELTPNQD